MQSSSRSAQLCLLKMTHTDGLSSRHTAGLRAQQVSVRAVCDGECGERVGGRVGPTDRLLLPAPLGLGPLLSKAPRHAAPQQTAACRRGRPSTRLLHANVIWGAPGPCACAKPRGSWGERGVSHGGASCPARCCSPSGRCRGAARLPRRRRQRRWTGAPLLPEVVPGMRPRLPIGLTTHRSRQEWQRMD
jgi:hypothetical protein